MAMTEQESQRLREMAAWLQTANVWDACPMNDGGIVVYEDC